MSATKWAHKNAIAMGKVAAYATGGVLVGYPLVQVGLDLWKGNNLEDSVNDGIRVASGYNPVNGTINTVQTRTAVIRTIVGLGAIYVAKKL